MDEAVEIKKLQKAIAETIARIEALDARLKELEGKVVLVGRPVGTVAPVDPSPTA